MARMGIRTCLYRRLFSNSLIPWFVSPLRGKKSFIGSVEGFGVNTWNEFVGLVEDLKSRLDFRAEEECFSSGVVDSCCELRRKYRIYYDYHGNR